MYLFGALLLQLGRNSANGIAIRYGLGGPGIECVGEIFYTRSDRFWGSLSLLCQGYLVSFPGQSSRGVTSTTHPI